MKTHLLQVWVILLCMTLLTGCPWLNPNPDPAEGEGEQPIEGESPGEGEQSREGEFVEAEFTSADASNYYRSDVLTEEPAMESDDEVANGDRELVEPDIIRRAGDLLFVLNQYRGLTIADLENEQLLSQTPTYGYPRDLYLVDERAYVLVSRCHDIVYEDGLLSVAYGSKIYVLNIADPMNVVMETSFPITGDLVDSRMVGDIIYAVCSDYTYYDVSDADGDAVVMDAAAKSYGATWAVSVNIADTSNIMIADTLNFPGYGNLIQATDYAIFSVSGNWDAGYNEYISEITYIDISDPAGRIVMRGKANAPGYMADRFKMDAWQGALRVVTNTWWPNRETYITTFDIADPDRLARLGQTTLASASGESLFATRFDGPKAYIVTYLMVDPLFVVDLSDPTNPEVKGELKIPGWSTHIEPRGDRLIALGVDDEDGRRVMVSLFDVSDPETPTRIAYESFGENWSWSTAYSDVKAFTVLDDMLLIPFSGWNDGSGGYDRLQFVAWSPDTLDALGYVDLQGSALRSFRSGGMYYAVTQEQLAVIDASNPRAPEVVNAVTLAENVVDVAPLADDWLVEVIARYDAGDTLLRASHPYLDVIGGSIELPVPYVSNTFVWNNAVAVVATVYEYEPKYQAYTLVFLVDFSTPENPVVVDRWQVDMEPWWGGWWYREPMMVDAIEPMPGKSAPMHWWGGGYGGDSAYLAGDYLVLRGIRNTYDISYGDSDPWQGLALVDLAGADKIAYVGLGYPEVTAVTAAEGLVYISTKRPVGQDAQQRNICAYYLHTLNPSSLDITRAVNVPGVLLHRLPGTSRLIFEDTQYADDWQTVTVLRSTEIVGSTVRLVDSAKLPVGWWNFDADGANLYYSGYRYGYYYRDADEPVSDRSGDYWNSYLVGSYPISRSGTFMTNQELAVSNTWINLLGVKDNQAYISVASAAIAQYNFNEAPPSLDALLPVMGYPQKIRFGDSAAFAPLGYSGLESLPY